MSKNDYLSRRRKNIQLQYSSINSLEVFEACGWECQKCGVQTPRELMGVNHPNAPTVDHVVPLSKGGTHDIDNATLLCRRCNSNKRNKM